MSEPVVEQPSRPFEPVSIGTFGAIASVTGLSLARAIIAVMPSQKKSTGQTLAQEQAEKGEALEEVMQELADVKKAEWRPRRNATVARRLGRFEDGIKRNSLKPPAA